MALTFASNPFSPLEPIPECNAAQLMLFSPNQNAQDVAVVDATTKQQWTYAQLRDESLRYADGLSKRLKRGDTLMVFSPNSVVFPLLLFGGLAAGLVVTTVNHTYTAEEVAYQLKDSSAKLIFVGGDLIEVAKEAVKIAGLDQSCIFVMPRTDGRVEVPRGMESYTQMRGDAGFKVVKIDKPRETLAYLPYSSGTTGRAKGVCLSHHNLASCATMINHVSAWKDKGRWLCLLPMYHAYGLILLLHQTVFKGGMLVTMPKFDFVKMAETVQEYKIQVLPLVPPILLALTKSPLTQKYDWSSLDWVITGAAPTSEELQRAGEKAVGATVVQGHGMTETSGAALLSTDSKTPGRVGWPIPGVEVRLVNGDGQDVKRGEAGELWLRGSNMMMGYLNNDKANKETFEEGRWMRTGDVAIQHDDDQLSIVDRIKELIKVKALQVAPAELEGLLIESPLVADAGVIGVWSEADATEYPRAYVVPSPEHAKDADLPVKIAAFVEKRVAPHKRLRGGVVVVEAIPKSPSGKILRKDLRAMASKDKQPSKL